MRAQTNVPQHIWLHLYVTQSVCVGVWGGEGFNEGDTIRKIVFFLQTEA